MKFKIDENFGAGIVELFQAEGHDAATVRDQGRQGCPDTELFAICCAEARCLVTFDLDFGDVTRFPPKQGNGIAVFRPHRNTGYDLVQAMVREFLNTLRETPLAGSLWIVEAGRIRIHQAEGDT